jgi:hypothetical protein
VGLAPLPDAVDVGWACEGIAVRRCVQPAPLAGDCAGLAARGLRAVALASGATGVGSKEGLTILPRALTQGTSHGPASPQAHAPGSGMWKEENGAEKSAPKKRKEHGRRG